jgi:UDP-N-acetylglucosamine--N-acetylmuramyl-(pentapeptide) pyrophosphoryl-undecaprenol N-acetylglucosamine transferase
MKKTIVFTGGGTGGHIYPGLAIAGYLRSLDSEIRIVWIGNSRGMDSRIVEKSGSVDKFYGISCGKLRRYFSVQNFFDVFKILVGLVSAVFILIKEKPAVLFSKGGFVSVPPCYAAAFLKIPVWTHECDFSPGLATRLNSKVAKRVFFSYEETKKFFPGRDSSSFSVSGNPIRGEFFTANGDRGRKFLGLGNSSKPILLVLGGSGGARQINNLVSRNLEFLCENFNVVHQTGDNVAESSDLETENRLVAEKRYFPHKFIYNEMCDVVSCADVILSRSGANSIWEAAICKKPMLLIPLEGEGTRGDQVENAEYFAQRGSAVVLRNSRLQGDSGDENFRSAVLQFTDSDFCRSLSHACEKLTNNENPAKNLAQTLYREALS